MTLSLERIRRLRWREVSCRVTQESAKRVDRSTFGRIVLARRAAARYRVLADDPLRTQKMFDANVATRFFEGPADPALADLLQSQFPDHCREIVEYAASVRQGTVDLLGYHALDCRPQCEWSGDGVSRRRAPRLHWTRLDPLDPAIGDSKVIWELNRHQYLVTLAQAFVLTGDEGYADRVVRTIAAWDQANPYGRGINWASSLEVSYRLIAWCWALVLLRKSRALTHHFFTRVALLAWQHARHIRQYLSFYFSPNTHLTGEALGLLYAGLIFDHFREAPEWRSVGYRILVEEAERQILDDGVFFEQSTCYQRYTVDIYLHFLWLSRRNDLAVPHAVRTRVERAAEFLWSVSSDNGTLPSIGDSDSGQLLPLTRKDSLDCSGTLAVAATVFDRPDLAIDTCAEPVWLFGRSAREVSVVRKEKSSRVFPNGGYVIMRDSRNGAGLRLLLDAGPLGCPISAGHGHADFLSLQCWAFGVPFLIDPGTFCYTRDSKWRDHFRSLEAHNTVTIDGRNPLEPTGPFKWSRRADASLREWQSTPHCDYADAECMAYDVLQDPVRHRRRVLFLKPRCWIVIDDLIGRETHLVEQRFQFAVMPVKISQGWVVAEGTDSSGLWLASFCSRPLTTRVVEASEATLAGWVAAIYGQRQGAPVVSYSTRASLPLRLVSIIAPQQPLGSPPPADCIYAGDGSNVSGLRLWNGEHVLSFEDRRLTVNGGEFSFGSRPVGPMA